MKRGNGLSGLANLGNTCYLNTFIQCLSHTHEFNHFLDNYNENDNNILLNEWNTLRKLLWHRDCTIAPKRFVLYLQKVSKKHKKTIFTNFSQNDVSELMYFIFELFHNYLKQNYNYKMKQNTKIEKYKKKIYSNDYSIITRLFQGIQVTRIRDMNENILSETPEPFMILPVPIMMEQNCTIKRCIEEYCNTELLNGENQYARTRDSDSKIDANKDIYFYELPPVLIISLKRFNNNNRKNKDVVVLEENINLDNLCCSNNNNNYELYGINLHTGNVGSGHYMAAIKNKNWYLFNDMSVTKIKFSELRTNYQAYCLFYRKKNSSI
jgi:ubiquitin C-terminal hydrolase